MPRLQSSWLEVFNEVALLNECSHPNVVRAHSTYSDCGSFYLVLEYCEWSLDERAQTNPLPTADAIAIWSSHVLAAVAFLHGISICHRDVKPANFLVLEGSPGIVKLADFGVSARLKAGELIKK